MLVLPGDLGLGAGPSVVFGRDTRSGALRRGAKTSADVLRRPARRAARRARRVSSSPASWSTARLSGSPRRLPAGPAPGRRAASRSGRVPAVTGRRSSDNLGDDDLLRQRRRHLHRPAVRVVRGPLRFVGSQRDVPGRGERRRISSAHVLRRGARPPIMPTACSWPTRPSCAEVHGPLRGPTVFLAFTGDHRARGDRAVGRGPVGDARRPRGPTRRTDRGQPRPSRPSPPAVTRTRARGGSASSASRRSCPSPRRTSCPAAPTVSGGLIPEPSVTVNGVAATVSVTGAFTAPVAAGIAAHRVPGRRHRPRRQRSRPRSSASSRRSTTGGSRSSRIAVLLTVIAGAVFYLRKPDIRPQRRSPDDDATFEEIGG